MRRLRVVGRWYGTADGGARPNSLLRSPGVRNKIPIEKQSFIKMNTKKDNFQHGKTFIVNK